MPGQTGATPATSDATTEPNDQANPAATGETPSTTPPPTTTPPPAPPATDDADALGDPGKRALDRMKAERDEAERLRKKAEGDLKKLQEASLSEQEKRDQRLAELEAEKVGWERERQQNRIEQAVGRLATKLKLVDVETVVRLVDPAQVTFDDQGSPTNVEQLVTDLVKEKAFLVGQAAAPPPAGGINAGDGTSGGPPPKLTAEELQAAKDAGMTPERYAQLKSVSTLTDWQATRPKPTT
jgi:hypothetical protein